MQRLVELAEVGKGDAEVHERFGRIGPELDRLAIPSDRFVEPVLVPQHIAQVIQNRIVVGSQNQSSAMVVFSLVDDVSGARRRYPDC